MADFKYGVNIDVNNIGVSITMFVTRYIKWYAYVKV